MDEIEGIFPPARCCKDLEARELSNLADCARPPRFETALA